MATSIAEPASIICDLASCKAAFAVSILLWATSNSSLLVPPVGSSSFLAPEILSRHLQFALPFGDDGRRRILRVPGFLDLGLRLAELRLQGAGVHPGDDLAGIHGIALPDQDFLDLTR